MMSNFLASQLLYIANIIYILLLYTNLYPCCPVRYLNLLTLHYLMLPWFIISLKYLWNKIVFSVFQNCLAKCGSRPKLGHCVLFCCCHWSDKEYQIVIVIKKLLVLQQIKENGVHMHAYNLLSFLSKYVCLQYESGRSSHKENSAADHKMPNFSLIVSSPWNSLLLLVAFPFSHRHRIVLILLHRQPLCLFYPHRKHRRNKMIGALIS